jgi:hypothetical protein
MSEIKKSLLQCVTSQEIDDLIIESQLVSEGYHFHYFIDTHDINKYTYPFGLIANSNYDDRASQPVEIITDEQISYHYLINHRRESLLLFNEHLEELDDFKKKIDRIKSIGLPIVDALQKQVELFDRVSKGQMITFEEWKENLVLSSDLNVSYLISIALGSLYDGMNRLNYLLEKKLCYNDLDKLPKDIDKDIFENAKPAATTEKLFEQLCNDFNDAAVQSDLTRLIARYKKCIIYDRLLGINQIAKKKEYPYLFLLVSSGKTTNNRLPKIASKLGLTIKINGKDFNPTRSVNQIYLQLLLDNRNNKNNEDKINELRQIKELISLKENDPAREGIVDAMLVKEFAKNFSEFGEGYENISLLLSNFYKEKFFREAMDNKNIRDNQTISKNISVLLKIVESNHSLENLRRSYVYDISISKDYRNVLQQAVKIISGGSSDFNAYEGSDHVTNIYNALPLVFLKEGNSDFQTIIDKIAEYVQKLPINKSGSKEIIQSINKSFALLFYKVVPSEEEKIIMLIIFLMLNIKTEQYKNSNEAAYHWIKEMVKAMPIDKSWMPAFRYVESWIARRVQRYDESIQIAEKELPNNEEDPRFYHSIHLSCYNLYVEEKDEDKKQKYLIKSLSNCEKAYEFYKKLEKTEKNSKSINIAFIAILNSLTYLTTLKYSKDKNVENLKLAANYLFELKHQDNYYFQQAEFAHTEAFLSLNEYDVKGDSEKLKEANQAIDRAIRLNPKEEYRKLKTEIESRIA